MRDWWWLELSRKASQKVWDYFLGPEKDCPDLGRWKGGGCSSKRARVRNTVEVGVGMAFD